jgi:hypothetical protein
VALASVPKEIKSSALDGAAQVLRQTGQALSCQELIAQMAANGSCNAPQGQTSPAMLYTAVAMSTRAVGYSRSF